MDFSRPGIEFKRDGIEVFLIKDSESARGDSLPKTGGGNSKG